MKMFADAGRGGHFSFVANMAIVVAVAATALAMLLERATKGPDASEIARLAPNGGRAAVVASAHGGRVPLRDAIVPQIDGVDMAPTASIGRPVVLNPCLEQRK